MSCTSELLSADDTQSFDNLIYLNGNDPVLIPVMNGTSGKSRWYSQPSLSAKEKSYKYSGIT